MKLNELIKEEPFMKKRYYSGNEIEKGLMPDIDQGIFTKLLLQNLRAQKKLSYVKIGGRAYYTQNDIELYIDKNRVKIV